MLKLLPYFINKGYEVVNVIDRLPNHKTRRYLKRDIQGIDKIIIHHTASEAPLLNQATFHVNGRGWPRIGYSIVIVKDKIYQTNYLETESYQCAGQNRHGIGVCVLADFSKRDITEMEMNLLTAVIVSLKEQIPSIKAVYPHKAFQRTSCPVISIERILNNVHNVEEEISFHQDTSALAADGYKLATRVQNLSNKLNNATWGKESSRKLHLLNGLIEGDAQTISTTILNLYKTANDELFVGDNAIKLSEIIEHAKKVKLI